MIVETDQPLVYPAASPVMASIPVADPAVAVTLTEPATLVVRVHDSEQAPVAGAHVWAIGTTAPAHAVTDKTGLARVVLPADTPATVQAIHVRPVGGYWPVRLDGPNLQDEVQIQVPALSESFDGFPDTPITGWGIVLPARGTSIA